MERSENPRISALKRQLVKSALVLSEELHLNLAVPCYEQAPWKRFPRKAHKNSDRQSVRDSHPRYARGDGIGIENGGNLRRRGPVFYAPLQGG